MSEPLYLLSMGLMLGTVLLVFGMKYLSAALQARARVTGEGAYRALAEKAVATQSQSTATLCAIQSELSEVKTRLAAVETILKAVG